MDSSAGGRWRPPRFLAAPPLIQPGHIERTELSRRIESAVHDHRVTLVAAPAGYGKTSVLSAWSRRTDLPVAWLTLTDFATGPENIYRGLVTALSELAERLGDDRLGPLAALDTDLHDVPAQYSAICNAVDLLDHSVSLVVDDAHLVEDAVGPDVFGALIKQGPPRLRMVIGCRNQSGLPASRASTTGSAIVLGAQDLAFSVDEIRSAAQAADLQLSQEEAEQVRAATGGWGVAVRLAIAPMSEVIRHDGARSELLDGPGTMLTDYVAEHVLGRLPEELLDFVLVTTTCSEVDARLAQHLTGRVNAHELLEEMVRRSLFVDRYVCTDGRPIYRWHSVFATACRAELRRRDPDRADLLNRRAAERKQHWNPLGAAALALRGNDPALAVRILENHWLTLVIQDDVVALERLCIAMPSPWWAHPVIRIVRACCLDILQDRDGARFLLDQVAAQCELDRSASSPALRLMVSLATLLIADEQAALWSACDEVAARLRGAHQLNPAMHATAVFLLGWTELRLRRDPLNAARLLQTAVNAATGTGQRTLARRARGNLAFAHAFSGDLVRASEVLTPLRCSLPGNSDEWWFYDGGIESFTAGFVDYWRNDLHSAWKNFDHVVDQIGGEAGYAAMAQVFRALTASAIADPRLLDVAEAGLRVVPAVETHGLPWAVYATLARAKIAAARGDADAAAAIASRIKHAEHVPIVAMEMAEIFRRAGHPLHSARLLQGLSALGAVPTYVRVGALLTHSLIRHRKGEKDSAYRLLENSLDIAWPQRIARPFSDANSHISRLLMEHMERGTKHQEFVASLLAAGSTDESVRPASVVSLSRREREVLGYLRGTMSTAEIAAELHVSVSTIKTHLRAIYRKLGVSNRRAAVALPPDDSVG